MRGKSCRNAPHPALRATFSPKGRRDGGRTSAVYFPIRYDVFDLGLARSREAERAIKAAMDLTCTADPDPQDILRITGDLSRVLSDTGRLREESPFVAAELERQGRLSLVAGSP